MAIPQGMLERFSSLISSNDDQFIKVELSDRKSFYGCLREVANDFFVIEEMKTDGNNQLRKLGRRTLQLSHLESFSEIPVERLPSSGVWI